MSISERFKGEAIETKSMSPYLVGFDFPAVLPPRAPATNFQLTFNPVVASDSVPGYLISIIACISFSSARQIKLSSRPKSTQPIDDAFNCCAHSLNSEAREMARQFNCAIQRLDR